MTDDDDDDFENIEKDAFVMPVLPKSLKVDPILAAFLHLAAFLELSGDDTVDPVWAVEAMEHAEHYLQQLPAEQIAAIQQQISRVAEHARKEKWNPGAVAFFAEFLENFGVGVEEE